MFKYCYRESFRFVFQYIGYIIILLFHIKCIHRMIKNHNKSTHNAYFRYTQVKQYGRVLLEKHRKSMEYRSSTPVEGVSEFFLVKFVCFLQDPATFPSLSGWNHRPGYELLFRKQFFGDLKSSKSKEEVMVNLRNRKNTTQGQP